ncbi:GNAT family N-acetyltransferase [Gordonia sp. DT101]|uniref:GNAT family N-acetyltransferase n=1 Tax=Gordonia sp. DT101 TaxID=3416545 RepID=UPI003CFA481D
MANDVAVSRPKKNLYTVTVLGDADAGEILTLQRAAYVTEAQAHRDFDLPPLTQSIDELREGLAAPDAVALGVRDEARLIGAVRLRRIDSAVDLGRLTVVPDRQGQGIGSFLLREAETVFPDAREMQLFTGEHSTANIRLYERSGYVETARTNVGDYSLVHFTKSLA